MTPPFNRRDSACYALCLAMLLAALAATAAWQAGFGASGAGLGAIAAAVAAVLLAGILTRRLPPDITLRRLTLAGREDAAGPPASGMARMRIAFAPAPLGFARIDILLDGVRVGQLCPGMAFVVPVRSGLRVLSARMWLRPVDLRDRINALPGTDSDITIRVSGSKTRSYGVERASLAAVLRDRRTVLVSPAVREA